MKLNYEGISAETPGGSSICLREIPEEAAEEISDYTVIPGGIL